MQVESLLGFLIIGAIAGWIAGKPMQGSGFGILGNIVVGVLGAVIGGAVFGFVGITSGGMFGSLVTAVVGAAILLFVVGLQEELGEEPFAGRPVETEEGLQIKRVVLEPDHGPPVAVSQRRGFGGGEDHAQTDGGTAACALPN